MAANGSGILAKAGCTVSSELAAMLQFFQRACQHTAEVADALRKRPASEQQPEVYLEPKWLRCKLS